MTCLDYEGSQAPLTATKDGDNFKELCDASGVQDITYLRNNECHKENVISHLREIASRCEPDDFFIYFYAGHGANVPDKDHDEDDGQDEALCLVTPDGSISKSAFLVDDEFCDTMTSCLHDETHFIVITDCCHSGTIADLRDPDWSGHKVVALAGCQDDQTSGDTGQGGIMTHAMLCAIQELAEDGDTDYTMAKLYNKILECDDALFGSKQDISLSTTQGYAPKNMAWPLIPSGGFTAPYNK
jgi:hypothetical protein